MQQSLSRTFYYEVTGMKCHKCLFTIKKYLDLKYRFTHIRLDISKKLLSFVSTQEFDEKRLIHGLGEKGFGLKPIAPSLSVTSNSKKDLIRLALAGACAGNIMLVSFALYAGANETAYNDLLSWLSFVLYIPSFLFAGVVFFENSLAAFKMKKPSIDVPIALALLTGTLISFYNLSIGSDKFYFDSLSVLIFLILSSRYIVARVSETYLSPVGLADVLEDLEYEILRNEDKLKLKKDQIAVGDQIKIKKGDFIPVDSELMSKKGIFDFSLFSGESLPVELKEYDKVFAGSKLYSDSILVVATESLSQSRISKLIKSINSLEIQKTEFVQLVDRASNFFTYSILAVSFIFLSLYSFISFEDALNRVLALMVIACPCALAIMAPLVISLGIRKAFFKSVLIKKVISLEKLSKITDLVFDKTGTLTDSSLDCVDWSPREPSDKEKAIIFSLENESEHPLAKAILRKIAYQGSKVRLKDIKETPGLGVSGIYDGDFYEIKRSRLQARQQVGFFKNGELQLTSDFRAKVFAEVKADLSWFKENSYRIHLLTGDIPEQTQKLVNEMNVAFDSVKSDISPEEKAEYIKSLQNKPDRSVLFMGDGINDSSAISVADIGISAFNSSLSSFKVSDIHLNLSGLSSLKDLFEISKQTRFTLKRNLIFSIFYNLLFGALALSGMINPLAAAILMPLSTLSLLLITIWSFGSITKGVRK